MKIKFLAAALAATAASPALAADVDGGRFEAMVGYDHVVFDLGDDLGDDERGGVMYGLGVGYDFAMGATSSIGIDLEATDATTDIEADDGEDSAEVSLGRDLYAGVRFTSAVSDMINIYGKLGYTNARVKAEIDLDDEEVSESANLDGVRAGVGAQIAFGTATYAGVEYRYSNYEADVTRHQVAGSFGIRF